MEERIKYLFRQYLDNSCSRKEFEEFLSYIRKSAHDDTINSLIKNMLAEEGVDNTSFTYVDETGSLILLQPDEFSHRTDAPVPVKKPRKSLVVTFSIAAVVILLVVLVFFRQNGIHPATGTATVLTKTKTERSEYKYMLLPDSTQVWLNAASTIEFPGKFAHNKREIFLSGEAYFDVKHADKIPFIIHTGKVSTTVLGTAFNVKAYPGSKNVVVAVSRGKVKVSYNQKVIATLIKGQQVKVNRNDSRVVEKKSSTGDAAGWQRGNMVFDEDSIEDIIADLERIYNVTVKINNPFVSKLNISTSFKSEIGVEQALQVLCRLTDTELKISDGVYVIQ